MFDMCEKIQSDELRRLEMTFGRICFMNSPFTLCKEKFNEVEKRRENLAKH